MHTHNSRMKCYCFLKLVVLSQIIHRICSTNCNFSISHVGSSQVLFYFIYLFFFAIYRTSPDYELIHPKYLGSPCQVPKKRKRKMRSKREGQKDVFTKWKISSIFQKQSSIIPTYPNRLFRLSSLPGLPS